MFFGAKVTKAPLSRISPEPCESIDQVFTPPLATRRSSFERFSIDTWTGRSPILAKLWRRQRRGMWSKKYSSARPGWRKIPGFQQDASWFKARWRAEMRPPGRKWLRGEWRRKLHCVAAFNEQSAKAIFRKTPNQPNWPIT